MNQPNHDFAYPEGPAISDRMRELLARAAQDQVSEQRTQGAALEELRQRLEGLEWLLQQVREKEIGTLTDRVDSVRAQLETLRTRPPQWAESLAAHIDDVAERAKPIEDVPTVRSEVGGIAESVDAVLGKLQSILDKTQQTASRVDELSSRMDKLQTGMDTAGARFNRIEKVLGELSERVGHVEDGLGGTVERVEESLGQVARGSENVGSRLQGLDGRLEGLHGRLDGFDGRLEGFDGRLDAMSDRVEGLPAAMDLSEVHRRLADLTQRPIVDPASWLNSLDQRLANAMDELGGDLRARPDREEFEDTLSKIIDAAHAEWARRLTALEETMLALAEALLRPAHRPAEARGAAQRETRREARQPPGQETSHQTNQQANQERGQQTSQQGGQPATGDKPAQQASRDAADGNDA